MQSFGLTVFRMLTEAGLLVNGEIMHATPSGRVADALDSRTPSDIRSFPTRSHKGGRNMTPSDLTSQEEHLFAVLSGERFLKMEGLSNEVPFFHLPL